MSFTHLRNLALVAVGAVSLAGCAGVGPYYGASVGLGNGYNDPYYNNGYSPYGSYGGYGGYGSYGSPYGYNSAYGYGAPSGGWYQGYYYPGTGAYVYDQQRRRVRLSDSQRRYWERQRALRQASPAVRQNVRQYRTERRDDRRAYRVERQDDRAVLQRGEVTRREYRADRQQDRREYRRDQRQDTRELRRENRRDRRNPK